MANDEWREIRLADLDPETRAAVEQELARVREQLMEIPAFAARILEREAAGLPFYENLNAPVPSRLPN